MKPLILTVFFVWAFSACNEKPEIEYGHQAGILPNSIEQISDVFELKYGEVKECNYDGQVFSFSIMDVEDNLRPLNETEYISPENANKIRMCAYLCIETNRNVVYAKVCSKKWGPYGYENDGTDVQQVWEEFKMWDFSGETFSAVFGEGTLIKDTSFSIYMAKAFPFAYMNRIPDKREYKFIFIITKK